MLKLGMYGYDDTCVKVYDPSLPDGQKLIATYDTYKDAGNKLGLTSSTVQHRCVVKTRVYSPILGKEVAIRLSAKEKTNDKRTSNPGDNAVQLIRLSRNVQTMQNRTGMEPGQAIRA
jgi:hypothetical protein